MQVFVLTAEHQTVPGLVQRVYKSLSAARAEAASLVRMMQKDAGREVDATDRNYEAALELLQDEFGAAHCYVDISEMQLLD